MPQSAWKHDPDRPHFKMNPNSNLNPFLWKEMQLTVKTALFFYGQRS